MEEGRKRQLLWLGMKIRKKGLEAVQAAGSGHIGGSFSLADILAVLYFDKMRVDPRNPKDPDRDRFVLSKGHCTPAMYAALALKGFFPESELKNFRSINSNLSGHVEMTKIPGVDMSAGSLGQGFSAAVGMAVSGKVYHKDYYVYTVIGDGELQEGQIWEAFMAAGNYKLDHLIAIIDNNNLQIDGTIEEVMSPYPIDEKLKAFKWNVLKADGHDPEQLANAIDAAKQCKDMPSVIIAKTIKGRGVSFMENNPGWHGKTPDAEQYGRAFEELNKYIAEWEAEL